MTNYPVTFVIMTNYPVTFVILYAKKRPDASGAGP